MADMDQLPETQLMEAIAKCATISSRPTGAPKNPFPARIINR
jgi:hypothetical protein